MGKSQQDDDEELVVPQHLVDAAKQRALATLAMAAFDKYCASLPANAKRDHPTHPNCLQVSTIGKELSLVEVDGVIGIAAPPQHAAWLQSWPASCIVATEDELFFVSKEYAWLNTTVEAIGVSSGALAESELLQRLCSQKETQIFSIESGDSSNDAQVSTLNEGRSVPIFHSRKDVPLLKTQAYYLSKEHHVTPMAAVKSHFA